MRIAAYRLFVMAVLLISPILFPLLLGLLCVLDGGWPQGGLFEMYRPVWQQLIRGYP